MIPSTPLDTFDILERLVAFPTMSENSNRPLIDWIRNYLQDYGIESHLVPDATALKSNLFATVGHFEQGGTAINILAGHCEFGWEVRTLPGDVPTPILESLAAFAVARLAELEISGKHCDIQTTQRVDVPPLTPDPGPAEALVRAALGNSADSIAVPFSTEGGQFQRAGWSTVICGPGRIEQAHKPDEFIGRDQLEACEQFLGRLTTL